MTRRSIICNYSLLGRNKNLSRRPTLTFALAAVALFGTLMVIESMIDGLTDCQTKSFGQVSIARTGCLILLSHQWLLCYLLVRASTKVMDGTCRFPLRQIFNIRVWGRDIDSYESDRYLFSPRLSTSVSNLFWWALQSICEARCSCPPVPGVCVHSNQSS